MSEKSEAKFDAFRKDLAGLCIKHGVVVYGGAAEPVYVAPLDTDVHNDVFPNGIEDGAKDDE